MASERPVGAAQPESGSAAAITVEKPGSIFRNPHFRRLFVAHALSKSATSVNYIAIPLVAALALNASPAEVGLLGMLTTVAVLMIGLPAGAWVDRSRRRGIMVVAEFFRALLFLSVPAAWWFDWLTIHYLYLVVFLAGFVTVFFDVSAQSFVPFVVGRDRLVEANTKLAGWDAGAAVAGPGAGGYLVQWLTAPMTVLVSGIGFLWSGVTLLAIRRQEPKPDRQPDRELLREIRQGLHFVFKHPLLRPVAIMGATVNLSIHMIMVMMPIVYRDLDIPASDLGIFIALGGLGGLAGATTGRRIADWLGYGRVLWLGGVIVAPFGLVVPWLSPGLMQWVVAGAWLVLGYRVGMNNVLVVSLRQSVTPAALLGRVNATIRFMLVGALAVGAGLSGMLGQYLNPFAPLWVSSVLLGLAWLPIFYSPLRTMRKLPVPPTENEQPEKEGSKQS